MRVKKIIAVLCLVGLICGCLSACLKSNNMDTTETFATVETTQAVTTTESTTRPAEDPTESATQPEETEPAVEDQTAIDIVTTDGVVLVGQMLLDEEGWYFQLEQPLNITFEYFLDNPTVYPEQTTIRMFDPKDDYFDKSIYLGQKVTASGVLRYYRDDFETLYFAPYAVTLGKTVECSYAEPGLAMPDEPENLYDPSRPLPKYMDPMIFDGQYIYNAFMLSMEAIEYMGNDFADFYVGFVDAFLNYESTFECPDKHFAEMLHTIVYDEFPLYDACADPFEYFLDYDPATGIGTINYKYDRETFDSIVNKFMDSANDMLANTSPDFSDEENARNIYHALSTRMTYDYSALEDFERKESYYAYLDNTGVCVTFANVYNQLLTQVGIETTMAYCDIPDDSMGHAWSIITIDGEQYFCDPTFELSYDGGSGYRFYGMNYADRTADGLGSMGIRCGRYYCYQLDPSMIAENSLDK